MDKVQYKSDTFMEGKTSGDKASRLAGKPCQSCNLCGHLQRCQVPDIENSRKTARKGAERVPGKVPAAEKQADNN